MLKESFIVHLGSSVFGALPRLSPTGLVHEILRRLLEVDLEKKGEKKKEKREEKGYALTEWFVLFDLALAIVFWFLYSRFTGGPRIRIVYYLSFWFAVGRLYEMVVYHVNVVLFHGYNSARQREELHQLRGYRRMVVCLLTNYVEALFWFAVLYQMFQSSFSSGPICPNSRIGSLYYSVITMTTLGYGDIRPIGNAGATICMLQTLVGMFLVIVMLAAFIRLLPKPYTKDQYERWEAAELRNHEPRELAAEKPARRKTNRRR
ncbi:MAG: potassium channel family protein [Planctomycetota bacterium]